MTTKPKVKMGQEWAKDHNDGPSSAPTRVRVLETPTTNRVKVGTVTPDGRVIREREMMVSALNNTRSGYRLVTDAPHEAKADGCGYLNCPAGCDSRQAHDAMAQAMGEKLLAGAQMPPPAPCPVGAVGADGRRRGLAVGLKCTCDGSAFKCCGGTDEHPPEHTQDCATRAAPAPSPLEVVRKRETRQGRADQRSMEAERVVAAEHEADASMASTNPLALLTKALDALEGWSEDSAVLAADARRALATLEESILESASERATAEVHRCMELGRDRWATAQMVDRAILSRGKRGG